MITLNDLFAVVALGQISIVGATGQLDILHAVVAATAIGLAVVLVLAVAGCAGAPTEELEKRAIIALLDRINSAPELVVRRGEQDRQNQPNQ